MNTLCTASPSSYTLREGDIVGTDIVVELNGYNGDMCYTFPVGEIDPKVHRLLTVTKESLYKGIAAAKEGETHRRHRQHRADLLRAQRI